MSGFGGGAAPDATSEGGDVEAIRVGRVEGDALGVAEWQSGYGLPGIAVVLAEPEARAGRAFGEGHVDPAGMFGMQEGPEMLRSLPRQPLPGRAAVQAPIEAALLLSVGVAGAQIEDTAVLGI